MIRAKILSIGCALCLCSGCSHSHVRSSKQAACSITYTQLDSNDVLVKIVGKHIPGTALLKAPPGMGVRVNVRDGNHTYAKVGREDAVGNWLSVDIFWTRDLASVQPSSVNSVGSVRRPGNATVPILYNSTTAWDHTYVSGFYVDDILISLRLRAPTKAHLDRNFGTMAKMVRTFRIDDEPLSEEEP